MPKIKVLDTELGLDIMDADVLDRIAIEADRMKHAEIPEGKTPGETIRLYCQIIFDTFDHIFGDGTSNQIFGGVYNLEIALKAMQQLTAGIEKARQATEKNIKSYSVGGNRAQRRAKKK